LGKYPELIATKKCSVNVKYTEWYNKYQIIATQQAKYMSEYNKHDAVTNAYSTTVCCPTGDGKCKPKTKYYTEVYDVYSFNGNSFSTTSAKEEWGGCAGTAAPYTNSSAGTAFYAKREDMQDLFSYLKTCSIYLDQLDGMNLVSDSTNETEFYTFEQELKYYYAQKYSIDGTTRFNNEKLNNVDDSLMKSTKDIDATTTDGNFEDYKDDERTYTYFSRLNSISHKAVGKSSYDTINRSVSFKYTYSPSVNKYSDIYTAKISDIEADLPNPINLGYVYDTDVTAITQPNNQNYFIFTKLGDDNTIYNWFTSGGKVILKNKTTNISTTIPNATEENLKRKCDYEIINDLFKTPNTKLNIIYRSVDPANIDPNERLKIDLDGDIGFSNWDNKKGYLVKKQIEETAKTRDTYNQDPNKGYLEYSFKLDSATIAAIRNYNEEQDNKYDKWDDSLFTCENGNECESDFITQAYNGTFKDKDNNSIPKFATDISGRNKWKYMTLDESSNTWSIENYERGIMGQDTFNEYKELLGGLTP